MKDRKKTPNPSELINLFGADRKKFNSNEEKEYQKIEIYVYRFDFQRVAPKKEKTDFERKAVVISDERSGGFSWIWGEIGRPVVFLRPDFCQRAIETGYEWLVGTGWEAYTRDQNSGRCQSVTMHSLNKLPHLSKTIFYTATMPARTAVMGEGFSTMEKKKKKKMYRPKRYSLVNGA